MKYPRFIGKNTEKMQLFRLQKEFPIGNPARYPIGLKMPISVDVSFGVIHTSKPGTLRINENSGIKNSRNKLTTKKILKEYGVPVLPHVLLQDLMVEGAFDLNLFEECGISFPLVIKNKGLSGGRDMHFISDVRNLTTFLADISAEISLIPSTNLQKRKHVIERYYIEPKFNIAKEYRIHASPFLYNTTMNYQFIRNVKNGEDWESDVKYWNSTQGVFLVSRKMLTQEAVNNGRIHRNVEEGASFFKHIYIDTDTGLEDTLFLFEDILEDATLAISRLELDFGFVDVMVDRDGNYVITESGCNPGISIHPDRPNKSVTFQAYQQALPRIIFEKAYTTKYYTPTKQLIRCVD